MRIIKPLPEGVRSSVRSGVILYDFTRVVEDLVFNSLDAGATQVSVAVGVATCFVKVADNGSGIDRDGLVLLGERYVTSKHDHLVDLDTSYGSYGFHGEALCSISDVSVLEIISKAHGMPHGYRKVMKSCKCLCLGISDDRHDVGTTVIVRDLFYNQPVRRKHMQSRPKKVLHLAKKCILRIALVHSRVSFKVFDIESEDELLRTCSSPSPLSLLSTNFGIEATSSLCELEGSKGELKLFGYLSGPSGILSLKAFQYIYINSRFVCKGPIHKLLNQLAAVYLDDKTDNIRGQIEKPGRSLTCPTFILNLSCPRSHYDIIFEPLKSSVEFTDWGPVLEFIQDTVAHFWSENVSDENCESSRKRSRTLKWPSPVEVPFVQSEKQIEDGNSLPHLKRSLSSCQMSNGTKHQKDDLIRADCAIHLYDTSNFACGVATTKMIQSGESRSGNFFSNEDNYMLNESSAKDSCSKQLDSFLDSKWQSGPFEMEDPMNVLSRSPLCADFHVPSDGAHAKQVFAKPSQVSCLKGMSLQDDGLSFRGELGIELSNADFNMQGKWGDVGEDVDVGDLEDIDQIFEDSEPGHDIVKPLWLSKCTKQHENIIKSKPLPHDVRPSIIAGECSAEENHLASHSLKHSKRSGSNRLSSTSEWSPRISNCLFGQIPDADHFVGGDVHFKYGKDTEYDHFQDKETYCNFSSDDAANCLDVGYCTEFFSDCKYYGSLQGDFSDVRGHKLEDPCLTNCSNIFSDEVNWSCTNTSGKSSLLKSSDPLSYKSVLTQLDRNKFGRIQIEIREVQCQKREVRRSISAPPFYKRRRKCFDLNNLFKIESGQVDSDDTTSQEISNAKHDWRAFEDRHFPSKESYAPDSLCIPRLVNEGFQKKDFMSNEFQDDSENDLKWRKCFQKAMGVIESQITGEDDILDVTSDVLHFAGDSLVPTSINKTCLRDAKVLQQVDKKFIPVVARSILAIIDQVVAILICSRITYFAAVYTPTIISAQLKDYKDYLPDLSFMWSGEFSVLFLVQQHAADERIRLEELRQKVLSGEMKQITYLEAEKELVLPEIGYQLLHNYVEQTRNWGWICNIYGPGSRSFAEKMNVLHWQQTVAKLVAVPCILGVNLTDTDLLEFLQQLADTDGSSTMPPSVLRILNNKACRGAIMFGDTLLPSECSLIVEELKQTSLCFQCAHGRPTTVPLVNLDVLHKQIDKLALRRKGTQELWHGLCRHDISLERAACRLSSAME